MKIDWKDTLAEKLDDMALSASVAKRRLLARAVDAFDDVTRRYLGGHVSLGPLTLYGNNAMQWAANLRVPALGVTLCAKLPAPFERGRGWYFYASPNATPWAAVLACGPGIRFFDAKRIRERLAVLADAPHEEQEITGLAKVWNFTPPRPIKAPATPYIGTEN